jgi:RimJ/RimL family protein N-acetyltransferase
MAANTRSRRVVDRLGMARERTHVEEWDDPIAGWQQCDVVYGLSRRGGSSPDRIANTTS